MSPPLLHVYGQTHPHGDVEIVGTPDALLALQAGLIFQEPGKPARVRVMDKNGEHYDVILRRATEAEMDAMYAPGSPAECPT
jgi:hypothetical protein